MSELPLVIASDHAGFELKEVLRLELEAMGVPLEDLGVFDTGAVDYPDIADKLAAVISQDPDRRGLLICGTGIGVSIAANRHKHVRAALCHSAETATMAREHNDSNVLVLGGRVLDPDIAKDCLRAFLDTAFGGGRHSARVAKLS